MSKDLFENNTPLAVFVVSKVEDMICATTREGGRIGLPGGKVDPGENLYEAALREAEEEGWKINAEKSTGKIICSQTLEGFDVYWVIFKESGLPVVLSEYKEKYRGINPILVSQDEIASSGYGNDFMKDLDIDGLRKILL